MVAEVEERLQERVCGRRRGELVEAARERGEVRGGERAGALGPGERDVAYGEQEWCRRRVVLLLRVGVRRGHWMRVGAGTPERRGWDTRREVGDNVRSARY